MHIPDGYLSPSTCIAMYGAAAPFWYVALKKLKSTVSARSSALMALFAAFCFVVMMFNVPLPGGTSGHALGVGIATAILGPWQAIVALSIALTVQAGLFGDGGITTLGANCFNMAIVGSLVAGAVYRLVRGSAGVASRRAAIGAAVAGYCGVNAAALLAAIEFGVQPLWFKDAHGVPLYAPYPLQIAIPAMMIGHLTIAGLAEMAVSGGIFMYLQRTSPALLTHAGPNLAADPKARNYKPLWVTLAVLIVATPLGFITAASAWGEWSPRQLLDPALRSSIAAASRGVAPPVHAPNGMKHLFALRAAPFSNYMPTFLHSHDVAYIFSAALGAIVIISGVWSVKAIAVRRAR